jgi:hypothetical protein
MLARSASVTHPASKKSDETVSKVTIIGASIVFPSDLGIGLEERRVRRYLASLALRSLPLH